MFPYPCMPRRRNFPQTSDSGFAANCSQLQRAAVSIPANIAEGQARDSTKDYLRHLSIARGSLAEVETFMTLARRLNYISEAREQKALATLDELSRMLRGLQRSLREKLED